MAEEISGNAMQPQIVSPGIWQFFLIGGKEILENIHAKIFSFGGG